MVPPAGGCNCLLRAEFLQSSSDSQNILVEMLFHCTVSSRPLSSSVRQPTGVSEHVCALPSRAAAGRFGSSFFVLHRHELVAAAAFPQNWYLPHIMCWPQPGGCLAV